MTSRCWDILGIGDADVDIYLDTPELPGRDEKVLGGLIGEFPGGVVANFCCAASKAGARVALVSLVGNDHFGHMAIDSLQACGVDTGPVVVREGGQTYFCVVMLDDSGEKALVVVKTDCIGPTRDDIDPNLIGEARLIHLMANDIDLTAWIAEEAVRRGTLVSLDIEPTTVGSPEAMARLLRSVDLAFPNAAGLRALASGDELSGAREILALGPQVVVVTLGAQGCLVVSKDESFRVPGIPVPVADTTGAGDCFNGTFVAGYLRGWDLRRCAEIATAAAAISVTGIGSRSALATLPAIETFIHERTQA